MYKAGEQKIHGPCCPDWVKKASGEEEVWMMVKRQHCVPSKGIQTQS